jgi:hypothetical protein
MAHYKFKKYLNRTNHKLFDDLYEPGQAAPYSGIYRCEVCGHEDACIAGQSLPARDHHQHASNQGRIQWRLVVGRQRDPDT